MPTSLTTLVDAHAIVRLQDQRTLAWHATPPVMPFEPKHSLKAPESLDSLVEAQHAANYTLWHAEDEARRPGAQDADLARVKQQIDRVNQQRNDLTEQIDALLLAQLGHRSDGEQHSETPGMIMDRLSILSLRLFHTWEELERPSAPPGHLERNRSRLATVEEQRTDLTVCLEQLWKQICAGQRHFKQYKQLKMYNDPELNPVIYQAAQRGEPT
jgi:small-conductance mechanosensitive channel